MTPGPIPHAISRALERYGLKITYSDLFDMCQQCMAGYGRLSVSTDNTERHMVSCQGKVVVVVYAPPVPGNRNGKIITALPKEDAYPKDRWKQRLRPPRKLPKKNRQRKGY